MKKTLKRTGIILLLVIGLIMIFAFLGMKQTLNLDIQSIDLTQIPNGSYSGSYDCYRWSNKVMVTVSDHRITGIEAVKIQDGRESMVNSLTGEILEKQSSDVDVISGATASSNGYLRAVEIALKSAVVKS